MKRWIVIALIVGVLIIMTNKTTNKANASPVVVQHVEPYRMIAEKYGSAYAVPVDLILAHIAVESGGDPNAVSTSGAIGLMQVLPSTLPDINQMLGTNYSPESLFTPETAIQCGTAYLNWLLSFFNGDTNLAVRAYNMGPGNIKKDPTGGQDYFNKVSAYFALITGGNLT